jgi:hypothetical protein
VCRKPESPSNAGGVSKKQVRAREGIYTGSSLPASLQTSAPRTRSCLTLHGCRTQQPASKPLVAAKPAKAATPAATPKGKQQPAKAATPGGSKGAKAGGFSDENAKWLKPSPANTPAKAPASSKKQAALPLKPSSKKQAAPPPESESDDEESDEESDEGQELMEGESDEGEEEDGEGEDDDDDEEMMGVKMGMLGDDFPSGEMDGSDDDGEGEEEDEVSLEARAPPHIYAHSPTHAEREREKVVTDPTARASWITTHACAKAHTPAIVSWVENPRISPTHARTHPTAG